MANEPFWTILNHFEKLWTLLNHFEQPRTTVDYLNAIRMPLERFPSVQNHPDTWGELKAWKSVQNAKVEKKKRSKSVRRPCLAKSGESKWLTQWNASFDRKSKFWSGPMLNTMHLLHCCICCICCIVASVALLHLHSHSTNERLKHDLEGLQQMPCSSECHADLSRLWKINLSTFKRTVQVLLIHGHFLN